MPSLLHPTLRDISPMLDEKEQLAPLTHQCFEEFRADSDSCADWRNMHSDWLSVYFQKDRTEKPFEGASEDSLPILAEACDQFHARASKAMFPSGGRKIISCMPSGASDALAIERSQRVEKYLQWQLLERGTAYRQSKDAMLMALPLHGSMFTKVFMDPITGRLAVRNIRATDLILPYGNGPRMLEDLPRKTEIQWIPMHYASRLTMNGFFNQPLMAYSSRGHVVDKNPADDVIDDIMGFQEGSRDARDYALVLEQHRWADLDGDGIEEPYAIWLDAVNQTIVRIQIMYETDDAGVPVADKTEAMEAYTQFNFVPNPDGVYGVGHGLKIGAINHALNRLLRINLDSAMLAAVGNASGIINKSIGIKKGELALKLGKFITTETPVEDIRSQIMPFSFPGPNAAGINLMEMLAGRADRLSMVTEAITGQTQAVQQPTTIMALLEQSNIIYSAIMERVLVSWESELQKVYRTNRLYMQNEEYFVIIDANEPLFQQIASTDFMENFQIKVIADPSKTTQRERIAEAQAAFEVLKENPIMAMSPIHMRNATVRYLEAIGIELIDEIIPSQQQLQAIMQMQAQAPDPAIELENTKAMWAMQLEKMRGELQALADRFKAAQEQEIEERKAELEKDKLAAQERESQRKSTMEVDKTEHEKEMQIDLETAKMKSQVQIEKNKGAVQIQIKERELAHQASIEAMKLAAEKEMASQKLASEERQAAEDRAVELQKLELERMKLELEKQKLEASMAQASVVPVDNSGEIEDRKIAAQTNIETAKLDVQKQQSAEEIALERERLELEKMKLLLEQKRIEASERQAQQAANDRSQAEGKAKQEAAGKEESDKADKVSLASLVAETQRMTAELAKLGAAPRRMMLTRDAEGRAMSAEVKIGDGQDS